ncbi:MAG TPA: hypothetical protein DCS93_06495 [Microscillaceae bacterium]|nr:hypothetical protein [Microscillaceae bacterium]
MKNKLPDLYEMSAILIAAICLGLVAFQKENHYLADVNSLYVTLETAKSHAMLDNDHPLIKEAIQQISQQDQGYRYAPRLQQIRRLLHKALGVLETHKKHLKQHAYDATQPVTQYLIRERNGYTIQRVLNQYIDSLNEHYKDLASYKFPQIASGNKDHPLYSKQWGFVEKDFVHTAFENATVAEALTVITRKQTMVLYFAKDIIKKLNYGSVNDLNTRWLSIGFLGLPDVVSVGDTLNLEMFTGYSLHPYSYQAEINGKQVRFIDGKYTEIAFKTSGKGKQYWTGRIQYCDQGVEYIKHLKVPYWVK